MEMVRIAGVGVDKPKTQSKIVEAMNSLEVSVTLLEGTLNTLFKNIEPVLCLGNLPEEVESKKTGPMPHGCALFSSITELKEKIYGIEKASRSILDRLEL